MKRGTDMFGKFYLQLGHPRSIQQRCFHTGRGRHPGLSEWGELAEPDRPNQLTRGPRGPSSASRLRLSRPNTESQP